MSPLALLFLLAGGLAYAKDCDLDTDPTWCPKAARQSINCPENFGQCHEQIAELCPESCNICHRPICRDRVAEHWCQNAVLRWKKQDAKVPQCQRVYMAQDCALSCGWCSPYRK